MRYFAGIPYPDELAGLELHHYEAVLSALGIGVFLWDGGDSIGWDVRSRKIFGLPDDGRRFAETKYLDWAAMCADEKQFERAQQYALDAMETGRVYFAATEYKPPAAREVLSIGIPVDVRAGVRGLWGVNKALDAEPVGMESVDRVELARRLETVMAKTTIVADFAEEVAGRRG